MKLAVFVCLLILKWSEAAVDDDKQVMLCGRELAKARVLLCYGAEYLFKRSLPQSIMAPIDDNNWVWSGRRGALGARWSRHKRGLVDECCLKACTTEVIRSYC